MVRPCATGTASRTRPGTAASALRTSSRFSGGNKKTMHPPPPAPQTLPAHAPAPVAASIAASISGVEIPSMRAFRFRHSCASALPAARMFPAVSAFSISMALWVILSKPRWIFFFPSICRLYICQLFVPEKWATPV